MRRGTKSITVLGAWLLGTWLLEACAAPEADPIRAVEGFTDGGREGPGPRAFAVVATDRTVSSIGLLKPDGDVLERDFVHSGSAPTGLVTALSGDVVLPTQSADDGALTLIDRFRSDVITRIDPMTGEVLGQVKTHEGRDGSDGAAYSSNPQDYLQLDADNAWVSRFAPNEAVDRDHPDRGNDLLHIDPTRFERGERISLGSLNTEGERENPDTGETQTVTTYARPGAIVQMGDHLVVGLSGLSAAYDAAGPGMVALIDLSDNTVSGFSLPELKNCNALSPVPDDDLRVAVACEGFFRGDQRATAGLAVLALSDGALSIEHIWHAAEHPEAPLTVSSIVAISRDEVVAVAAGEAAVTGGEDRRPETNDVAYLIDLEDGDRRELFEAAGRYKIGSGAYNPEHGVLLIPDASVDDEGRPTAGIRRFAQGESGDFEAVDTISTHELVPPRLVRPL